MKPYQIHEQAVKGPDVAYALRRTAKTLQNIQFGLNNTDESKNIVGHWAIDYEVPTPADTEFVITHGLGYVPVGFHVVNKATPLDVYSSGTAWTTQNIYLKCNVASALVNLFIF